VRRESVKSLGHAMRNDQFPTRISSLSIRNCENLGAYKHVHYF
jgi:hypothetical protein